MFPLGIPLIKIRGGERQIDRNWRKREWINFLRTYQLNWDQVCKISENFGTAVPPPWNLWWSDLPILAVPLLVEELLKSQVNKGKLRINNVVKDWNIGNELEGLIPDEVINLFPKTSEIKVHGVIKCALMTLGLEHHHQGADIIIPLIGKEKLLKITNNKIIKNSDYEPYVKDRLSKLKSSIIIIDEENERSKILRENREEARREATTRAMQSGLEASETEKSGELAANKIIDDGPRNLQIYQNAMKLVDDDDVDKTLWLVRNLSSIRWEDAVPCRIGARMGRPEKSGIREMKPMVHSLYPIGGAGGPQRLMQQASNKVSITVEMSPRTCKKCGKSSGHIICHNRVEQSDPIECGGRTVVRNNKNQQRRRLGERTNIPIESILEVKRRSLDLERLN